ncbi:MAG: MFS transporter [Actinomycetota bacterium]|nr:MFS transporter [Actinomycetota bacterium]
MARGKQAQLDGPVGWLAAFAGCLINAWTFGVFYSFATAVEQMGDEFGASLSSFGRVFGITTFWFFCFGLLAGPLADRFGARPLILTGSAFIGVGLYMTAQAESLTTAYITYGVGVGTGIGLYLVPITVAVGGWFDKKRPTALGLTTAGIGLGTLLFVPVGEWLIRTQGWRDAFELMGIGSAGVYVVVALAMQRPPIPPAAAHTQADGAHMREVMRRPEYWRLYGSGLVMSLALFAPFIYLVTYATDRGASGQSAALLLSVLGMGSVAGRLGIGPIAARYGIMPLVVLAFAVQPIAYLVWLVAGSSYALMALFAGLLGVGYGGYVALSPVAAAELFGLQGLGRVLGVLYTSAGLGALFGPEALGIVIERAGFETAILMSVGLSGLATSIAIPLWLGASSRSSSRRRIKAPLTSTAALVFDLVPAAPSRNGHAQPADQSEDAFSAALSGGS